MLKNKSNFDLRIEIIDLSNCFSINIPFLSIHSVQLSEKYDFVYFHLKLTDEI